ncbi:MAG: MATE family efflux transporter [Planctomycetota bacterium]
MTEPPSNQSTAQLDPPDSSKPLRPAAGKTRVLINVACNWTQLGVHILVTLILVPFLIDELGETDYGVYATLASLLGFLMLLDMGATSAINRYVARYCTLGKPEQVNASVASGFVFFLVVSTALVLITAVLARPFIGLFPLIPAELVDDAVLTLQLIALGVGIRLLHGPYTGLMAGWQRYDLLNAVAIFELVLRITLIFTLIPTWRVIYVPALAFVISNAVALVLQIGVGKWLFRALRILPLSASRSALKEILTLGSHMMLITICTITIYNSPHFILTRHVGPESVTPFSVGLLLITSCYQGIHGISRVFSPLISSVHSTGDREAVARIVLRASCVLGFISAGICLALVVVGQPFIAVWIEGPMPLAYPVVAILAIAHAFVWPNTIIQSAFAGTSRLWPIAVSWIVTAMAIAVLSITLVFSTEWAGLAIAAGIAVPLIFQQVLVFPTLLQRHFDIDAVQFVARVHLRPLLIAGLIGMLGIGWLQYWTPDTWARLIVFGGTLAVLYALFGFRFGLDSGARQMLLDMVRRRRAARKGNEASTTVSNASTAPIENRASGGTMPVMNDTDPLITIEPELARLQTLANHLLTAFTHSRRGPRVEFWRSRLVELRALHDALAKRPMAEVELTWPAIARDLAVTYETLCERLPSQQENMTAVSIAPARLDKTRRHRQLASRLDAVWHGGLAEQAAGFYLHGSLATGDDIAYSDCDTYIVLRNTTVTCAASLLALRAHVLQHTWPLKAFDPHQHHGYFLVTEADLRAYPDHLLPVACLRVAACLNGTHTLAIARRTATEESGRGCRQLAESIVAQEHQDPRHWNGHALKSFLSRLMLLPTLVLGSRGQYVYKRESFELARPLFSEAQWAAVTWATRLRATWPLNTIYLRMSRRLAGLGRWGSYLAEALGRVGLDRIPTPDPSALETEHVRQATVFARRCLELIGPVPAREDKP